MLFFQKRRINRRIAELHGDRYLHALVAAWLPSENYVFEQLVDRKVAWTLFCLRWKTWFTARFPIRISVRRTVGPKTIAQKIAEREVDPNASSWTARSIRRFGFQKKPGAEEGA